MHPTDTIGPHEISGSRDGIPLWFYWARPASIFRLSFVIQTHAEIVSPVSTVSSNTWHTCLMGATRAQKQSNTLDSFNQCYQVTPFFFKTKKFCFVIFWSLLWQIKIGRSLNQLTGYTPSQVRFQTNQEPRAPTHWLAFYELFCDRFRGNQPPNRR